MSKGFQVLSNFLKEPLRENLSLSSFRLYRTSSIHLSYDGGRACFQLSKIKCLANRVQKAVKVVLQLLECCYTVYQKGQTKDEALLHNGKP